MKILPPTLRQHCCGSNRTRKLRNRIILLLLVLVMNTGAQDLYMAASIDGFAPALKLGIDYRFNERWGLNSGAGFCLVGPELLSANLFASYCLSNTEKPLSWLLHFGIMDVYFSVKDPLLTIGPGGGTGIRYRFKNDSHLMFRLGVLSGPQWEEGRELRRLTIPNIGITYSFQFPAKKQH